ncbi:MAG: hypothetical protein V2I43_06260, partial [Parvularcula sp.]|nr:hypothetical protein [Parvularcula sp.]
MPMTKRSPSKYFKTSPEIIRLAVMMYVRFQPSLRNLLERKGEVVAAAGARLDDLGDGSIGEYWRRTMRRHYGENLREVVRDVASPVEQDLRG